MKPPTPWTSANVSQEVEVEKEPLLNTENKRFVAVMLVLNILSGIFIALPYAFEDNSWQLYLSIAPAIPAWILLVLEGLAIVTLSINATWWTLGCFIETGKFKICMGENDYY